MVMMVLSRLDPWRVSQAKLISTETVSCILLFCHLYYILHISLFIMSQVEPDSCPISTNCASWKHLHTAAVSQPEDTVMSSLLIVHCMFVFTCYNERAGVEQPEVKKFMFTVNYYRSLDISVSIQCAIVLYLL